MNLLLRVSSLALLLVVIVGCGGKAARTGVKGKVTVNGKVPLTGGSIQFILVSNPNEVGSGQIDGKGEYEVATAPIGECKVVIDNTHLERKSKNMPGMGTGGANQDTSKKMSTPPKGIDTAKGEGGQASALKHVKIDGSYTKADTTPLKSTVSRDKASPADFDLK
jgi:hypothetical protein